MSEKMERGVGGGEEGRRRGGEVGEVGEWGLEGNLSLSSSLKSFRFEPVPHTGDASHFPFLKCWDEKLPGQLWSSCGYMTCALGTHLYLRHRSAASPTVELSSQTNNPPRS